MNCKTECNFLIMFSMVGRIGIRDGPRVENHWFKRSLLSLNLNHFFSTPSELLRPPLAPCFFFVVGKNAFVSDSAPASER